MDISKLINVKKNGDGSIQCQCPVCAQEGKDKIGKNHLRIWKNGAFNCIVDNSFGHNKLIRAFLGGDSIDNNSDIELIDPEPTLNIDKVYPESIIKKLIPDYSYWINRGAKEEILRLLEGGVAPNDYKNKLSGRFVFPIRGIDGNINGFTGRLIYPNNFSPTWKHLFKSRNAVWPWNISGKYIKQSKSVILVESVGDALALMSNEIYNVLCIFGLNLNSKIISILIANDIKKIIISLNRDSNHSKGQEAALKIQNRLNLLFDPKNIIIKFPPENVKDWGEASKEQLTNFKKELENES